MNYAFLLVWVGFTVLFCFVLKAGELTRDLFIWSIFSCHHFTAEPQWLPWLASLLAFTCWLLGWQAVYENSPRKIYRSFDDHEESRVQSILGGEVCLWSEVAGGLSMEGKLWPRASALGERLWSDPDSGHYIKSIVFFTKTVKTALLNCHYMMGCYLSKSFLLPKNSF
jgi:hypothetical protein